MRFDLEDWHSRHIENWKRWLEPYVGKPCDALEIGSCEGRSAIWLLENVLTNSDSVLTCTDPFTREGFDGSDITHLDVEANQTYLNFCENTKVWMDDPRKQRLWLDRRKSHEALKTYIPECSIWSLSSSFDIIYIDGSHLARDVIEDLVLAWPLLREGGTLIADDYEWHSTTRKPLDEPRMAIDAFLALYAREYEMLGKGVQIAVRKR